jgi:outer membrane protein
MLQKVLQANKSRSQKQPARVMIVAVFWSAIAGIGTAAAASSREQVAPTSARPWAPPNLPAYEDTLRKGSAETLQRGKEFVDLRKVYTLPDLIDLAEQLNPATRAAWQNARQALALVGASKSAYYPFLSLAAVTGRNPLWMR